MNFDETMLKRLTKLEREVERLKVKESPAGGSGVTDHGALTGLEDDDHTQYVKDAGTVTDNAIVRFNGTDGRTIQNSGVTIDDSNNLITTGGIHVGGTSDPGTDNLVVDGHANIVDYLTAEGGLHVGGTSDPGTDNLVVDGTIKDGSGNFYGRPVFLTTPKTSDSWDGDTKTTDDRATVDLSAVFGVPAGIKAVLMSIQTQADAVNEYIRFGPNSTYNYALICRTSVASQIAHAMGIVPCDSNGDVYCYPSGTIEGVQVWIWGYWL